MAFVYATQDYMGNPGKPVRAGDLLRIQSETRQGAWVLQNNGQELYIPPGSYDYVGNLDLSEFEECQELGAGARGRVVSVEHPSMPGHLFAKKSLHDNRTDGDLNELVHLSTTLRLRHTVSLVSVCIEESSLEILMLPVAKGNMAEYMSTVEYESVDKFETPQQQVLQWVHCLVRTLANVHRLNIIHRDIKPENILIHSRNCEAGPEAIGVYDDSSDVLFTDFGITREHDGTEGDPTSTGLTFEWVPPEAVEDETAAVLKWMRTGPKGDVFSLGCVIYEMLSRAILKPLLPFHTGLPGRDDEIIAYRWIVSKGGFAGAVEELRETLEGLDLQLERKDESYLWLTMDVLDIVVTHMLVLEHERDDSEEIVSRVEEAMGNWGMEIDACCAEGIMGNFTGNFTKDDDEE